VNYVALGQAQLIRSSHFGGQQRAKSLSSENMDEKFFNQAFEEYMESDSIAFAVEEASLVFKWTHSIWR